MLNTFTFRRFSYEKNTERAAAFRSLENVNGTEAYEKSHKEAAWTNYFIRPSLQINPKDDTEILVTFNEVYKNTLNVKTKGI